MDIAKIRKKLKGSPEVEAQKPKGSTEDLPSVVQKEDIAPVKSEIQKTRSIEQIQDRIEPVQIEKVQEVISGSEARVERPQNTEQAVITEPSQEPPAPVITYEAELQGKETSRVNLLVFKLAGEEYAFILEDVKEILKKQFITAIPLAPYSVIGITSLRGTVMPVIDLSMKLLGIPSKRDRKSRILIMEGKEGMIGCMVDQIEGVLRATEEQKKALPENMTDKEKAFIDSIFVIEQRFITLLKKDVIEIPEKGGQRSDVSGHKVL